MCRCPKCDTELYFEDVIDCDSSGYTIVEEGFGRCPKCKTKYWIDTVYNFSHYEIEEMKDEQSFFFYIKSNIRSFVPGHSCPGDCQIFNNPNICSFARQIFKAVKF